MGVGKVSDADFEAQVLKATEPVVVDFWAEWCGPCCMIAPALEEIAGTLNGKVKIVKLNVDESPATAQKYGIMSIPTLMLFKNGELASRQIGAAPKQKLEQWLTSAAAGSWAATASIPSSLDCLGRNPHGCGRSRFHATTHPPRHCPRKRAIQ